jgi:HK97 family phage major capsid protein
MTEPAAAAGTMDREAFLKLINEQVAAAIGPAIKAELEPLVKTQGGLAETLAKLGQPPAIKSDAELLGKYHYGRKARALAMAAIENGSSDPDAAAFAIKRAWAPTIAEPTLKWLENIKAVQKGLTVGSAISAGAMVFPEYDTEWIELLRNNAVFRAKCRVVPMPRGSAIRRRQTGAGTATYQGELGPITDSTQTVSLVNLSYKKLTAATVVSNDLIRFAGGGEADRFVQEDLLRVTALREDRGIFVGNPPTDAGSPQGIRYQTRAGNIAASAGTSLANFQSDLTGMVASVQSRNIPATPANSSWVMSATTYWTIFALVTTTGDWVFAAELAAKRLLGFPVEITTQIEVSNSWIGASGGMVAFCYWPAMEIHDSMTRTVEAFRGGAYRDTTGTIQSGISNDETVITCISEHDFFQAYDAAAAFRTGYAT